MTIFITCFSAKTGSPLDQMKIPSERYNGECYEYSLGGGSWVVQQWKACLLLSVLVMLFFSSLFSVAFPVTCLVSHFCAFAIAKPSKYIHCILVAAEIVQPCFLHTEKMLTAIYQSFCRKSNGQSPPSSVGVNC